MLRNYLKIALRNLVKNKVYSFINIGGLAVGMAVAMLSGLWIYDELSANKHHRNYETIYQVMMHRSHEGVKGTYENIPYGLSEELKNKFPDFKAAVMCDWGNRNSLKVGKQKFLKEGHYIGDEAIDMFSLKILNGNKNPLKEPYSIVLTDETSQAIFGNQDPIGKIIRLDNSLDLIVTAIVAKQPKNATLQFDYLVPWSLGEKQHPDDIAKLKLEWGNDSYQAFVQLKEGVNFEKINAKIKDVVLNHTVDNPLTKTIVKPEVFLFPMSKWRLYREFENGQNVGGFIKYVRLFAIFGFFILVIACINFMNLSTARSEKRAKEVGVRKSAGAGRAQLIGQFLTESILVALFALIFAIFLAFFSLPYFNQVSEKLISIHFDNPIFWGIMLVFTLFAGLLAGSYPALYLSSFNPIKILKGSVQVGKAAATPRKVLVVLQFTFSILLTIGTIIIYKQIQFAKNRPTGFNLSGLISIGISEDLKRNFEPLRNELLASGMVSSVCQSNSPSTEIWSGTSGWEWKNATPKDKGVTFSTLATTYDFLQTQGIKPKEGRDFSREFSTDSTGVLLNEAAVKCIGFNHPIGEILRRNGKSLKVIGLIPDINMESPFRSVSPAIVIFDKNWVNFINIRNNPHVAVSEAINKIQTIFDKYNPSYPFDFKFADSEYAKKYYYEELIGNLSLILSILSIFISCLGLFGLASFVAEQRTKEIGIRKVLGASVGNLWQLLSKDFVFLVIIACLIAAPIAYYLMNNWLQKYTYRIEISWWIFVAAGIGALTITLLTVSYQAIKAALMNPVKSLKIE